MTERNPGEDIGRSRDRRATEARILEAAQAILLAAGPGGFGVNVVAREAGVDKQLIYRYFGGLDGLLDALGIRLAQWWQEKLLETLPEQPATSYAELIERLALRLLHIMRTEPLAQQSLLWELTGSENFSRSLSASRTRMLGDWMARMRGSLVPPAGIDASAVNALLIAASSQIVLAGRNADTIIGLPAHVPSTWDRIERSLVQLVRSIYREV